MKTKLPTCICTVKEAEDFLIELFNNKEGYHPEDNANGVVFASCDPSTKQRNKLNELMNSIYELNFDPCEFIISNHLI